MRIASGDWAAVLHPARGAMLTLTRRGQDVLRPTPAGADDALAFACFPLVPYANRIADGAFAFDGADHRLPRNYPGQAHPLHGVGWLARWSVVAQDRAGATLVHTHDGDAAWPWHYHATQRIAIAEDGMHATLEFENRDDRAMPFSLGFHPYFARGGVRGLRFEAGGVWLADEAMLPTVHAAADALGDWSQGAGLTRGDTVDHCYTGWAGTATIARDDGDLTLAGAGTPLLHLYVPPGADFFCVEPVTAMPDAVNRGAGDEIAPGEWRAIGMTIRG